MEDLDKVAEEEKGHVGSGERAFHHSDGEIHGQMSEFESSVTVH